MAVQWKRKDPLRDPLPDFNLSTTSSGPTEVVLNLNDLCVLWVFAILEVDKVQPCLTRRALSSCLSSWDF